MKLSSGSWDFFMNVNCNSILGSRKYGGNNVLLCSLTRSQTNESRIAVEGIFRSCAEYNET